MSHLQVIDTTVESSDYVQLDCIVLYTLNKLTLTAIQLLTGDIITDVGKLNTPTNQHTSSIQHGISPFRDININSIYTLSQTTISPSR